MAAADPVRVVGLKELQTELKALNAALPREIRKALNQVAVTVAQGTQRRVPRGDTGNARASVKPASTQTMARVVAGGKKAPYYPWLDFGGTVGPGKHGKGSKGSIVRPFVKSGRYLYPTYSAGRQSILLGLHKTLVALAEANGLKVT